MKILHVKIDKDGNAQVKFDMLLNTEQFENFLRSFDQLGGRYKEDLLKSLKASLGIKHSENQDLLKNEKSKIVSFKFQWTNCLKKLKDKYRFHLRKADNVSRISRGIGIVDSLEVKIPKSYSFLSIRPKPTKRSENSLVWKNYDWSFDLILEFQE